jgi:hypothetical protein
MKTLWIATAAMVIAVLAQPAANAKPESSPANLQPFECNNTDSMNVGKFVSAGQGTQPLQLETVVHGTTCGYEGGQVTGVEGVTITQLKLQTYGTTNKTAFGPYIQIFYNGDEVKTIAIAAGRLLGMDGPFAVRYWAEADLGLPAGAAVNSMRIIANPIDAGDGNCLIRQVHVNGALVTRTQSVIDSCP